MRIEPTADAPWPLRVPPADRNESAPAHRASPTTTAALPFVRGMRVEPLGPSRKDLPEASGVVFHPGRGTVFVVGDRGHVAELRRDGTLLSRRRVGKLDLEGIAVGPGGRLYAVQEAYPPTIFEIDPDTLEITRRFRVGRKLDGERVLARKKNHGLEGIAWVPDERAFYVLNQAKPTAIVRLELPLDDPDGGKARPQAAIPLDGIVHDGASDLHWDAASGHFLVLEALSSGRGKLHEFTPEGEHVRTVPIPGKQPEGFTLDADGAARIAQDGDRLLRVQR